MEQILEFDDATAANALFGPRNANLAMVSKRMGISLDSRGATVTVRGEDERAISTAGTVLTQLYGLLKSGHQLHPRDFSYACGMILKNPETDIGRIFREAVFVISPKRNITPKTLCQRDYITAMRENDMVFAIGPAGTGKTYLAVATALHFLLSHKVKRIILTRPAVEAGEKLGFLPGDLVEKINPYLRPLYDALYDMLDFQRVGEMMETGIIEIAPLAFMRGRTLNDAFIILDEAQNTTPEQMKMFLTRLGFGSRAVITGDVTQIDLPLGRGPQEDRSGLVQAQRVLNDTDGLRFIRFTEEDVIRHPLVARIVQAYDRHQSNNRTDLQYT